LFTQPLSDYFSSIGIRPRFLARMTCLWRGYAGTWEIADGCGGGHSSASQRQPHIVTTLCLDKALAVLDS
jgi:hypothetical protein